LDCHQIIERIYKDKQINKLIDKLDPPELREDLRQEFAMVLFSYDCRKLQEYDQAGKLLFFSIRVLMNMATGVNGYFYRTYRKDNSDRIKEYLTASEPSKKRIVDNEKNGNAADAARNLLDQKLMGDANDAHESIIFDKFIELQSVMKVAKYYGIPRRHVHEVVQKTRAELKREIKSNI
jgi:hypothetical protein